MISVTENSNKFPKKNPRFWKEKNFKKKIS